MSAPKKRTILFVTATPANREVVNTGEEQREIERELTVLDKTNTYQFKPITAARIKDLRTAILLHEPSVFHFSGHGEAEGILLEDANRVAKLVSANALRDFLAEFPYVQCVVLNACYTDEQAAKIAEKVEYVVGMRAEIGSEASLEFATAFYGTLASGKPYEKAFSVAKASLEVEGLLDVAMPILKLRPAAPVALPAAVAPGAPSAAQAGTGVRLQSSQGRLTHQLRDIEWATVPGDDSFIMGSDPNRDEYAREEEQPQQLVQLPTFAIAKYPITNSQYERFVMAKGYRPPAHFRNGRVVPGSENYPVVNVSWFDATAYCRWLSRATNQQVWLPTEAQWEKAARGSDGRAWPWGDEPPTERHCNFGGNVGDTTPVDRYPLGASPYGVMDMAGNVREWTNTRWGSDPMQAQYTYPYDPSDDREDRAAAADICRVLRGGAYGVEAEDVRCAARAAAAIDYGVAYGGFRVVTDAVMDNVFSKTTLLEE